MLQHREDKETYEKIVDELETVKQQIQDECWENRQTNPYGAPRWEVKDSNRLQELSPVRDRLLARADQYRSILNGPIELRETNVPQLNGIVEAQDELLMYRNFAYGVSYTKDIKKNFRETLTRYYNGETVEVEDTSDLYPSDRLLHDLTSETTGSQMKLATVFPEQDLAPILAENGVTDVETSTFDNGREWGLVYTVKTPTGTHSFNVYEHRNSDNIIINGIANWDREEAEYGPYGSDSKYSYLWSGNDGENYEAARALTGLLKGAQDGTLPDHDTLFSADFDATEFADQTLKK